MNNVMTALVIRTPVGLFLSVMAYGSNPSGVLLKIGIKKNLTRSKAVTEYSWSNV